MIEISHTQARRLIRLALDPSILDEQWNALQAYLEMCAECRAYQDRQRMIERRLRRGLRSRWNEQIGSDSTAEVMDARHQRSTAWLRARLVGLALLVVSGLVRLSLPG